MTKHNIVDPRALDYTSLLDARLLTLARSKILNALFIMGCVCAIVSFVATSDSVESMIADFGGPSGRAYGTVLTTLLVGGVVACIITVKYYAVHRHRQDENRQKQIKKSLAAFAKTNTWVVSVDQDLGQEPGVYYSGTKTYAPLLLANKVKQWDVAMWSRSVGYLVDAEGKKIPVITDMLVICVRLKRTMPHIICNSKRSDRTGLRSRFPVDFDPKQIQILEGDFSDYFEVYTPESYERDARALLTPDVMQAMLRYSDIYDFEIVDTMVYAYGPKFEALSKQAVQSGMQVAQMIQAEFGQQNKYYTPAADLQLSTAGVLPSGKRLRHNKHWDYIVAAGVIVAAVVIVTIVTMSYLAS